MQRYKSALTSYKNDLLHHPTRDHKIWQAIHHAKSGIYACARAVIEPNDDTAQEATALRRLLDTQCGSALHLLKLFETKVPSDMHEDGIVGGYVFMILMTKVPGARLPYKTFCTMSRAQRDNVWEAFRKALE
jgi:hypothetical protein